MANMLGHKAWNRTKKCKRINCCDRPRWSQHGARQREDRQWRKDWLEEEPARWNSPTWGRRCDGEPPW